MILSTACFSLLAELGLVEARAAPDEFDEGLREIGGHHEKIKEQEREGKEKRKTSTVRHVLAITRAAQSEAVCPATTMSCPRVISYKNPAA